MITEQFPKFVALMLTYRFNFVALCRCDEDAFDLISATVTEAVQEACGES